MKRKMSVCLAQVEVQRGNFAANLKAHIELVQQAGKLGAHLVVFPELSLIGYELDLIQELAVDASSDNFQALSKEAVEQGVTIIAGCPLLDNGKPTIGAVVCFADGQVEFYHKQFLHSGEEAYCTAGANDYVFEICGYKVGLAICADFTNPNHAANAAALGADAYVVSALISQSGFAQDSKILASIAKDHQLPVFLSNHISKTGGWLAAGNNSVWNANGECDMSSGSNEVGCFLYTIEDK
ncbi:carbon-nitrogen hydrolase family protein [Pseudoalteromonas sp. S16_S37]|uniref:carbon-nitrogen hydrolase family protein n=1 Tax=Pseudoalteromonas sp. S16_S37 TaxID=2720228 RepID=UPI0016818DC8|nr:carbon-nitrogen hydrolase family protein [Pseudoalteromonas sp. S16_S37]MBD1582457.1 carbon-nitrogen hydrolase family protein [Pseudoalteromonas sp. S16_S37]